MIRAAIWATATEMHAIDPLVALRRRGLAAEADAAEEWLRFHGIDPAFVLCGWPVVRDEVACCVRYVTVGEHAPTGAPTRLLDTEAFIVEVTEQGEAPPLPFPAILRSDS